MSIQRLELSVEIQATRKNVWRALTEHGLIKRWMADPEFEFEISTNWEERSPIITKGYHHVHFENRGIVLQFSPEERLRYNYLSTLSRLADRPENYIELDFVLSKSDSGVVVKFVAANFPTETIMQHVRFYWTGTLRELKRVAEEL